MQVVDRQTQIRTFSHTTHLKESIILQEGVPEAARTATRVLTAIDRGATKEQVAEVCLEFMKEVKPLFSASNSSLSHSIYLETFFNRLRHYCFLESSVPEDRDAPSLLVSEAMWNGLVLSPTSAKYSSPNHSGAFHSKTGEDFIERFQLDLLEQVDLRIQKITQERSEKGELSRENIKVAEETAAALLDIIAAVVDSQKLAKVEMATEIATLLKTGLVASTDVEQLELLKLFASEISLHSHLPIKKSAGVLLTRLEREGVVIAKELKEALNGWSKQEEVYSETDIDRFDPIKMCLRESMLALYREKWSKLLEIEWLTVIGEPLRHRKFVDTIIEEEPAGLGVLPLVDAARLTAKENDDFSMAGSVLVENIVRRSEPLVLCLDSDSFHWPRLAEALLLVEAVRSDLRVEFRSPAPLSLSKTELSETESSGESNEVLPEVEMFLDPLVRRERHFLPICLAVPSARKIIEHELKLATQNLSIDEGDILVQQSKTSVRQEVAMYLGKRSIEQPCAILRDETSQPLAIIVMFSNLIREVSGYSRHNFGDSLTMFIRK